jgi:hypothetical protein
VEFRLLIALALSWISALQTVAFSVTESDQERVKPQCLWLIRNATKDGLEDSFGSRESTHAFFGLLKRLKKDVNEASFSLHMRDFETECTSFSLNVYGLSNLIVLSTIGLFTLWGLIRLFQVGDSDFCKGRYLAFTWELEDTLVYKVFVCLIATEVALAIIGGNVYITIKHGPERGVDVAMGFWAAKFEIASFFLALYGLINVDKQTLESFNFHDPKFHNLVFNRSWKDFFLKTNNLFASTLGHACLRAWLNDYDRLQELLPTRAMDDETMSILVDDSWRGTEEESEEEELLP